MTTKSTKSAKNPTLLEQVQARHDERQSVVTARETELDAARKRNVQHTVKRDSGALDYDALGHIEDEHTEAALVRFLEAQAPHMEVECQAVDSYRIAETVGDLATQREALGVKRAEAVEAIRKALAEYVKAVEDVNSSLTGFIGEARRAGLIEGDVDPTLPVVMGGGMHGHPRHLTLNGERYAVLGVDLDAIVREARR